MTQPDQDVLADLVSVTLIYDPALGSPPETQSLGGQAIALPSALFPLPQRGTLLGQPGFSRQSVVDDPNSSDPTMTIVRWEWVMLGATDPIDTFVDSLTGRPGWVVPASRAVMKTMVQRLFSQGISRAAIAQQVPQLYAAIAAEVRAEGTT